MGTSANHTGKPWVCIPLRFFFVVPGAPAGIGIGPTSSSLSSWLAPGAGFGPSTAAEPSSSRSRFPRIEASSTMLDMADNLVNGEMKWLKYYGHVTKLGCPVNIAQNTTAT